MYLLTGLMMYLMKEPAMELIYEGEGERLDIWLARALDGYSRTNIQKIIARGDVLVNGAPAAKKHMTKAGDRVQIEAPLDAPPDTPSDLAGQDISLNIIYEDSHIIIVDKPSGMVVHPGNGNRSGTLANALAHHCAGNLSDVNGAQRPGIVHRLDKDTSGLIVAAKTNEAHFKLANAFKERRVRKIYNAIVCGHVEHDRGRIDMPIGRHATDRKRMAVVADRGRHAVTLFKVVERLPCALTWLELNLLTGRTHQIRVHLAHIGHPVVGDPVYGTARDPVHGAASDPIGQQLPAGQQLPKGQQLPVGQFLHSTILEFDHPISGERIRATSPLPGYFPINTNKY
ncbi:MAG: RluA family pseudouridine synthase [Oscillospiraceae bacterium]|nr:RluA family pseudouridine synthase [Oscillospiraceae bacterium]